MTGNRWLKRLIDGNGRAPCAALSPEVRACLDYLTRRGFIAYWSRRDRELRVAGRLNLHPGR